MSNFGKMHNLRVGGLPVGEVLAEKFRKAAPRSRSLRVDHRGGGHRRAAAPHQINRLCKRVALGIGRVGSLRGARLGGDRGRLLHRQHHPAAHPEDGLPR